MKSTATGRPARKRGASGSSATRAATPAGAAGLTSDTNGLAPFRARLDTIDEAIARQLGERFAICRAIALHKRAHEIPMMQANRVAEVRERYLARGAEVDLPDDFTAALFELLIAATCKMEDELIEGAAPTGARPPDDAASLGATVR